jgi:hypothetical protein
LRSTLGPQTFVAYALELYVKVVCRFPFPRCGRGVGTVITTAIDRVTAELNGAT